MCIVATSLCAFAATRSGGDRRSAVDGDGGVRRRRTWCRAVKGEQSFEVTVTNTGGEIECDGDGHGRFAGRRDARPCGAEGFVW